MTGNRLPAAQGIVRRHPGLPRGRRCRLFAMAALLAVLGVGTACGGSAGGGSASLPSVTIAWVTKEPGQLLPYIALDSGYFKKYGVNATVTYIPSSATGAAALGSGKIQFATIPGTPLILADAHRLQEVAVMSIVRTASGSDLVAAKGITSLKQVAGKAWAVSKKGSSSEFYLLQALHHFGVNPRTVRIVPTGSTPAAVAALQKGVVAGVTVDAAAALELEKAGVGHMLVNGASLHIITQSITLATTRPYLDSHRTVVQDVVKAMIAAEHRFVTDPAFAQQEIRKYLNQTPAVAKRLWGPQAKQYSQHPWLSPAAMQTVVDEEVQFGLIKPNQVKVSSTYDLSVVGRLIKDGFVQQATGQAVPAGVATS
jgi:NitT/TauT family transport system substrate-binding protein